MLSFCFGGIAVLVEPSYEKINDEFLPFKSLIILLIILGVFDHCVLSVLLLCRNRI